MLQSILIWGEKLVFEWRTNKGILARMYNTETIKSWRSQDIIIQPSELLTIIQDGKVVDSYTEQRINNAVGGLGKKLFFRNKVQEKFLFSVSSPFLIQIPFSCISLDGMDVKGVISIDLQFQQTDAHRLVNLFSGRKEVDSHEGPMLTTANLSVILAQEVTNKVLSTSISKYELSMIRNSAELKDEIKNNILTGLRRTFSEYGITFRETIVVYNSNAFDKVQQMRGQYNLHRGLEKIEQDARIDLIQDKFDLLHKEIELESKSALLKSKGENDVAEQKALSELRIMQAKFDQDYENNLRMKLDERKLRMETFELEQKKQDMELERRIASGDTTAQEREFILEKQRMRNEVQTSQLDASRDMKTEQLNRTQIDANNQVELMQSAMKAIQSGKPGSAEISDMLKTMLEQQAQTQRENMQQETLQQKEMLKQQTAQEFFNQAGNATNKNMTFVQGDFISGNSATPPPLVPASTPSNACSTCGNNARYIQQYKRWYCDACRTYLP